MENFVKTSLHLGKTYKTFPASWKNLEAFPCALKKNPAVYKKIEKKVQANGKNFGKKSCNSDQKALRKLNIGISKAPT